MKNRLFYFIPLSIALLLTATLAWGLLFHREYTPSPLVHKKLPHFSLPLQNGDGELSPDSFKGQYALLNIFASWCVSCQIEHPQLMQLGKQIPIYGISWKDKQENTENWLKQRGNPYQAIGMDQKGLTVIDLGVTGAPETFLINPEGTILFRYPGPLTDDIIKENILPLMKQEK